MFPCQEVNDNKKQSDDYLFPKIQALRPYQILSLSKKDEITKTGFKTKGSYKT